MKLQIQLFMGLALMGLGLAAVLTARGVSSSDRDTILKVHNDFRSAVSPSATNMRKMHWSDDLARAAQHWVDQCISGHDSNIERRRQSDIGVAVGQNWAGGYRGWAEVVKGWHSEVDSYDFQAGGSIDGGVVGHYTQVVWHSSSLVGCAFNDCDGSKYYVCNYAYGNGEDKPYSEGKSCSACSGRCVDNMCDCPNGKVCKNGGKINLQTCTCTCENGFTGDQCEICPSEDVSVHCGNFYTKAMCSKYSNVPEVCPVLCGFCP